MQKKGNIGGELKGGDEALNASSSRIKKTQQVALVLTRKKNKNPPPQKKKNPPKQKENPKGTPWEKKHIPGVQEVGGIM